MFRRFGLGKKPFPKKIYCSLLCQWGKNEYGNMIQLKKEKQINYVQDDWDQCPRMMTFNCNVPFEKQQKPHQQLNQCIDAIWRPCWHYRRPNAF